MYTRLFRILYRVHPAFDATRAPGSSRRRDRDVAIDCDCDDREIAADDGRRCANRRGEATDATRPRRIVTSRGFDVGRAFETRTTDAHGRRMRERFQSESLID